jgi:outer membrane protein
MIVLFIFAAQVDSLSLEHVIDLALARSPFYYEAKATLTQSRISFYQTLSSLLPTISVSGTYTVSEFTGVETDNYSGSATLSVPLFDLDVISAIMVSNRTLKGSSIQHRSDIAQLMLELKIAYYSLVNAQELLASSEIAITRAEENQKLIDTKYELGAASRLEKLQGEVFYLRAQQDRAQARTAYITAQEELKSLLGLEKDIYAIDSLWLPDTVDLPTLDSLALILEEVNYAIHIAQEIRNVAHLNLIASYLAFLPKVSFFYGYTYTADSLVFDFEHFRDNSSKNYGIRVSFPIFEIKSLIFNYLNSKTELQKQEYTKKRVILETEKSLRTTYYSLQEAYERLKFAERSLDAASEATSIAKEQYALGVISFLDLLSSEKDYYEAKVSMTSALSDYFIQRATLSYLLGEISFTTP